MQEFLTFVSGMAGIISDFLLTEPISWFLGLFLLSGVVSLFHKAISR